MFAVSVGFCVGRGARLPGKLRFACAMGSFGCLEHQFSEVSMTWWLRFQSLGGWRWGSVAGKLRFAGGKVSAAGLVYKIEADSFARGLRATSMGNFQSLEAEHIHP